MNETVTTATEGRELTQNELPKMEAPQPPAEAPLGFYEYQVFARQTKTYTQPVIYPALGLGGESGEVLDKVKKILRDKGGAVSSEDREELVKECGDVLWYIANFLADLDVRMDYCAVVNLRKLKDRMERGVISGNGDNR